MAKAFDDQSTWYSLNIPDPLGPIVEPTMQLPTLPTKWQKPSSDVAKCNVGAAWCAESLSGGVSWIVRDHTGKALFHSCRSYAGLSSGLETELWSFIWAIESLATLRFRRVIFEAELLK